MASTRRQKQKGKSLCMTDFFINSEQVGSLDMDSPPTPVPTLSQASEAPPVSPQGSRSPGSESSTASRGSTSPFQTNSRPSGQKRGSSIPISSNSTTSKARGGTLMGGVQTASPSSRSPLKHSAKLDVDLQTSLDENTSPIAVDPPTGDALESFPTSDQAASERFMKEMILALRSSIQQGFTEAMTKQSLAIDELGERVSHVENKMGEYSDAHNTLVDAHNQLEDDVIALKAKLADLEDRSRRNNIKLRGVPESVLPAELVPYIQRLIKAILPSTTTHDLVIDRAHRLPKPKGLSADTPRDVIARIHFFHIKEDLMITARKIQQLPDPFTQVKLFADLSQTTLRARKLLAPVTLALRNHGLMYRWGFPTKIIFNKNGVTSIISSLEEGIKVLEKMGITLPPLPSAPPRPAAGKLQREWTMVKGPT